MAEGQRDIWSIAGGIGDVFRLASVQPGTAVERKVLTAVALKPAEFALVPDVERLTCAGVLASGRKAPAQARHLPEALHDAKAPAVLKSKGMEPAGS